MRTERPSQTLLSRMLAFVLSALLLAACHSSDAPSQRNTTAEKSNAAYDFVTTIQALVSPVVAAQDALLEFAQDVERDLNEINQSQLRAMGKAINLLFEDLDDYIASAFVEDNNGNVTAISWDQLPDTTRTYNDGVSIKRIGNAILLTGTDVTASYGDTVNSIDATMLISLPTTTITDNTITLSISDLYIADDYLNRLESPVSYVTISVNGNYSELKDVINDGGLQDNITIQITDATVSLANAITLIGNGVVTANNEPMSINGERSEQIDFNLTFTGELGNSLNHDFTAPLTAEFTFHEQTDWVNGSISSSGLTGLFAIDVLLTEATPSATAMIAHLNYNVTAPEQDELARINASEVSFQFDPTVSMSIDSYTFILYLREDESPLLFRLTDASQAAFDIALELYLDTAFNFDQDNILIGQVTVDGQRQASIILDAKHKRVTAQFSNKAVILVSDDSTGLFKSAN